MASPEEKLIIAVYAAENFKGKTLRQVRPRCCGREVDVFSTRVKFRDIQIGSKNFTLLEPDCPICCKRVRAEWTILS